MTAKEIRLVATMLDQYSDQYLSNAGCNDTPRDWVQAITNQELIAMDREFNEINGTPEDHDVGAFNLLPDYCYVALMRHKLEQLAKELE